MDRQPQWLREIIQDLHAIDDQLRRKGKSQASMLIQKVIWDLEKEND